jgi:hypothetical protein
MKTHQILEIVGLILLLVSVGWELFFTISLELIEKAIEANRIHEKLDQLRDRQLQLQRHLDFRFHEQHTGVSVHGVPLSEDWNHSASEKSLERVTHQHETFRRIKLILFIIGSGALILAKTVEYSSQAATPLPIIQQTSPGQLMQTP